MTVTVLFRPAAIIGTLPNQIANGQTADAVPLMADLNWIVSQVNANASELSNAALLNAANSFTMVQSGVNATNSSNFPTAGQVQNSSLLTLSSTLGTNTITGRIAQLALAAYTVNQIFTFIPSQTNTGAATLNINGVNPVAVQAFGSALVGGEIKQGVPQTVVHDGSVFQLLNSSLPAGTILPFAGATTPTGFILCDGAEISRTAFRSLFAAIGTTWGVGDGALTFNVPDLRGRSLFGRDNMGGVTANRITMGSSGITGTTLGAVGGNQGLNILGSHLPSIGLVVPSLSVAATGTAASAANVAGSVQNSGGAESVATLNTAAVTVTGTTGTGITSNLGNATAAQTMNPAAICNFIIKY